jgi:hypothetical protein
MRIILGIVLLLGLVGCEDYCGRTYDDQNRQTACREVMEKQRASRAYKADGDGICDSNPYAPGCPLWGMSPTNPTSPSNPQSQHYHPTGDFDPTGF